MATIPEAIKLYKDSIELYTFASQFRDWEVNKYSLSRALRTALQHPECPWHYDAYESLVDWWLYATKEECENTKKEIQSEQMDDRKWCIDKEWNRIAYIQDQDEDIEESYINITEEPTMTIMAHTEEYDITTSLYMEDELVFSTTLPKEDVYIIDQLAFVIKTARELQTILYDEMWVEYIEIIIDGQSLETKIKV